MDDDRRDSVELFISYILSERRYSAGTAANYRRDVLSFIVFMGQTPAGFSPRDTSADDIREWIMHLSALRDKDGERQYCARSVNRMLSSLRAYFSFCLRRGLADSDPTALIRQLKAPKRLPEYIQESGMEQIADSLLRMDGDFIQIRDSVIVLMLYGTGLRLAEITSLDISDLDDGLKSVRVTGKGDRQRVVPIVPVLRERLKRYLELRAKIACDSEEKSLFLTKGAVDTPPVTARIGRFETERAVKDLLSAMGVKGKCSPHVLRHTFATHLLNQGVDIREIQELMGHSSLRATQVYTHNSIARLKETYETAHPRAVSYEPNKKDKL